MKKTGFAACLSLVVLTAVSFGTAGAQNYPTYNRNLTNPYQRAPIGPYVNLVTGPGTIRQNYFGIVQPQQQDITAQNQLGLGVVANQQGILGLQTADQLITTGHPVRFGSYERYFQNLNATAGGLQAAGAANFGANLGQGGGGGGQAGGNAPRTPARGR
jgi:hypothetical protein